MSFRSILNTLCFVSIIGVVAYGAPSTIRNLSGDQITRSSGNTIALPDANDTLVGRSTQDTLTNKVLDGGTASATSIWKLPSADTATLSTLLDEAGKFAFDTDKSSPVFNNGAQIVPFGSGAGAGGVNYFENFEFDDTAGTSVYDNGGAYVDGTGGTPTAITRAVTTAAGEVLSGNTIQVTPSSLKISKAASDGTGEGLTLTTLSLDRADRGSKLFGSFKVDATDANYASGDLELYAYDVAQSKILPVSIQGLEDTTIPGFSGEIRFTVDTESGTTGALRLSLHLPSDGAPASAWEVIIDAFRFGPQEQVTVMPYDDAVEYTPTYTGFGTVTNNKAYYRRVGDYLEIQGSFTTGTVAASLASVTLPSGLALDTAKLSINNATSAGGPLVGSYTSDATASGRNGAVVTATTTSAGLLYFGPVESGANNKLTPRNGNDVTGSTTVLSWSARVPIAGWGSNAVLGANRRTYRASEFSWVRVTSTPTQIGQYRSYLRNSSALTWTETNGAPGTLPSSASGFLLYGGNAWGTADSNNEPSRYDIYIGKNKSWQLIGYSGASKTGAVSFDLWGPATTSIGSRGEYNPQTGILTVVVHTAVNFTAESYAGTDVSGIVKDAYFDVIFGNSPSDLFLEQAKSSVTLWTGNGHGSTATAIRRFTNSSVVGSGLTYSDSSTNGATITVNEPGLYAISYSDIRTGAGHEHGISLNASSLTTAIGSLSRANGKLKMTASTTNAHSSVSVTVRLAPGDVIRPHDDTTCDGTTDNDSFTIIKIAP